MVFLVLYKQKQLNLFPKEGHIVSTFKMCLIR